MCGRYALALWPSQIRRMLRDDNMPADEAPDDPDDPEGGRDEDGESDGAGEEGGGGGGGGGGEREEYHGPRQSYNFAPSYRGVVYRADVPDWGAGPRTRRDGPTSTDADDDDDDDGADVRERNKGACKQQRPSTVKSNGSSNSDDGVRYKLQTMKWGLVPFWTKRTPGYGSTMKTINCRDDSLAQGGGMWSSMKARKRCVVVAQGFYEWLKKDGGREKLPHYVKRKDGKLMCFAGLWDVVQYENEEEKQYTYTIITTASNAQLRFLHDRMPAILDNGSEKMRKWLDPGRHEWSQELQSLLAPYDGELDVYPVSKDVGKVGNDSPSFIIPVDSKENKSNIANFFARGATTAAATTAKEEKTREVKEEGKTTDPVVVVKTEQPEIGIVGDEGFITESGGAGEGDEEKTKERMERGSPGVKREPEDDGTTTNMHLRPPSSKRVADSTMPATLGDRTPEKKKRRTISATRNNARSPAKSSKTTSKSAGSQKITKFFANSS